MSSDGPEIKIHLVFSGFSSWKVGESQPCYPQRVETRGWTQTVDEVWVSCVISSLQLDGLM